MNKNNKLSKKEELEFEKHLQKLEDPSYEGETNFVLSKNATVLDKSKYEICQKILAYKLTNKFTREEIANKISLSKTETEDILFAKINNFTLDRLVIYASKLFNNLEVGIIRAEEKRIKLHA